MFRLPLFPRSVIYERTNYALNWVIHDLRLPPTGVFRLPESLYVVALSQRCCWNWWCKCPAMAQREIVIVCPKRTWGLNYFFHSLKSIKFFELIFSISQLKLVNKFGNLNRLKNRLYNIHSKIILPTVCWELTVIIWEAEIVSQGYFGTPERSYFNFRINRGSLDLHREFWFLWARHVYLKLYSTPRYRCWRFKIIHASITIWK